MDRAPKAIDDDEIESCFSSKDHIRLGMIHQNDKDDFANSIDHLNTVNIDQGIPSPSHEANYRQFATPITTMATQLANKQRFFTKEKLQVVPIAKRSSVLDNLTEKNNVLSTSTSLFQSMKDEKEVRAYRNDHEIIINNKELYAENILKKKSKKIAVMKKEIDLAHAVGLVEVEQNNPNSSNKMEIPDKKFAIDKLIFKDGQPNVFDLMQDYSDSCTLFFDNSFKFMYINVGKLHTITIAATDLYAGFYVHLVEVKEKKAKQMGLFMLFNSIPLDFSSLMDLKNDNTCCSFYLSISTSILSWENLLEYFIIFFPRAQGVTQLKMMLKFQDSFKKDYLTFDDIHISKKGHTDLYERISIDPAISYGNKMYFIPFI